MREDAAPVALRLCAEAELEAIGEGRARGFDPRGSGHDSVFVLRYRGALHAWRNACPHIDGAPMAWRKDAYLNAAGTQIVCAAHGAAFEPDTGLCVLGPCVGRRLTPVQLVRRGDGSLGVLEHAVSNNEDETWQQ
jgi:nitrite reductase/ring-hydroxylating ferredoxin subunit